MIYIVRHGEKPDDKSVNDLSIQGVARANYLVNYWINQNISNPTIIYCFKNGNGIKNRSYELMAPLSYKYNIPINSDFKDKKDEKDLVDHIMSSNDKIILICWEHSNIPLIVKLIYDKMAGGDSDIKNKFKYWALDPENGKSVKGKKTDDEDLYSLTLLIDTGTHLLTGFSQSDNFANKVLLIEEPVKTLFTING